MRFSRLFKILIGVSIVVTFLFVHFFWLSDKFVIWTDVTGKKIHNYKNMDLYVVENGTKEYVNITKGEKACGIIKVKTNKEGVHALYVVTFGKYLKKYPFVEWNFKSEFYVLFISQELELKHKKMPFSIKDIEWVNDQLLKVVYEDEGNMVVKHVKNPF